MICAISAVYCSQYWRGKHRHDIFFRMSPVKLDQTQAAAFMGGGSWEKKSMGSTLAGSLHDAVKLLLEISGPESPLLKMIDWRSWIISRLRALWKRSRKPLVASRLEKEVIGLSAFVSTAVDGICCIHTSFWDRFHRWNTVVIGTGVREKGTPSS